MIQDVGTGPYIEAITDLMKHTESMNNQNREFVMDMHDAFRTYRERTRISEKQRWRIALLAGHFLGQDREDELTGQLRIEGT